MLEGTDDGAARASAPVRVPRRARARRPAPDRRPADDVRERWRARLASGDAARRVEGLALLADYGVPVAAARGGRDAGRGVAAADELGWPVALKTAAPGRAAQVRRRTACGSGSRPAEALRGGVRDLSPAARPAGRRCARWRPPGVEIALGIVRDPQFGPLVLVAAGGVLVELLQDRRLALPPLDEAGARAMIDRLQVRPAARRRARRAGGRRRRARARRRRGCRCWPPTSATTSRPSTRTPSSAVRTAASPSTPSSSPARRPPGQKDRAGVRSSVHNRGPRSA